MTNFVITALPTFTMCTYLLPKTVIKQIGKFKRHCLWRGSDPNFKKPSKAAWDMVCVPKENGGLGVLNLYTQNESLLLKHLHKFYNKVDAPWVNLVWSCHYSDGSVPPNNTRGSFWWKDILKSLTHFKGMAVATISDGSSCLFWTDLWNGRLFSAQYLELFSFANDAAISVQFILSSEDLADSFHLPLSSQAYSQFQQLLLLVDDTTIQEGKDVWTYIWGSHLFASSRAYLHLSGSRQVHSVYKWLWSSHCQPRRKFFFWLLLKDRLNTREILQRKSMDLDNYNCELCHFNTEETLLHLFFHCPFAMRCWNTLGCTLHSGRSSWFSVSFQDSDSSAFLYGNYCINVLGYLDCKK